MAWRILKLVACISGVSMLLSASTGNITISAEKTSITQPPTQLSIEQLQDKAVDITVKILSTDFLGSGILLNRQDSVYTVLTNAHVLRADDPPYRIQTPDGEIYQADVPKNVNFQDYDLAILQFTSIKKVYAVAALGASPKVRDEVFVAGFPVQEETEEIKFVFNNSMKQKNICKFLFQLCVSFDSLAPSRLALRANLRLIYFALTLALGCVLGGQIQSALRVSRFLT